MHADQARAAAFLDELSKIAAEEERKSWAGRHPVATGLGAGAAAGTLLGGSYYLGGQRGRKIGFHGGRSEGLAEGFKKGVEHARAAAKAPVSSRVQEAAGKVRGAVESAKGVGRDVLDMIRVGGRSARRAERVGL